MVICDGRNPPLTQEKPMPSRDFRRATQKKGENVSDIIEKRHETHPFLYGFSVVVLVVVVVTFVLAGPGGPLCRGGVGASGSIVFGSYNGHDIAYYPGQLFRAAAECHRQPGQEHQQPGPGADHPDRLVPGLPHHRAARGDHGHRRRGRHHRDGGCRGQGAADLPRLPGRERQVQRNALQRGLFGGQGLHAQAHAGEPHPEHLRAGRRHRREAGLQGIPVH